MEKSHLGFDVIIVGGGIVGVTLAACLKRTNLRIAIVEAQPLDVVTQRQRAYAMSLLSQRLFQELGVWEVIAARSGKYRNIQLSDEDFSGVVRFSRQDLKTDFLGFSGQHKLFLKLSRLLCGAMAISAGSVQPKSPPFTTSLSRRSWSYLAKPRGRSKFKGPW